MAVNYAYYYAIIDLNSGLCIEVTDTTNYYNRADYIPIDEPNGEYLLKYYYPIPQTAGDFNGKWYTTADHSTEWVP